MRIWAFILTLAVAGLAGQQSRADYLNPTSHRDCQTFNWTISQQLSTARQTANQCFSANYATPGNFPRHMSRNVCGKENYYDDELPACAGTRLRVCQIEDEIQRRENICKQRLASYQARQAALDAQRKEAERLQQENDRIARENGRGLIERTVLDKYGILPDGPGDLANDTHDLGARVAQMSGVRMTGDQSAYTLSRAMSQVGNRVVGRLTQRSLQELDGALTQFDANNPRPTAAQLETYTARQAAVAGQYATHMTRVQNTDYTLPLTTKSAVMGAYAGTILQLVELRNAGEIDEPIATLGAVAATYLAVRAYREAEERVREQRNANAPVAVPADQLRVKRQAVIAPVREARARAAVPVTPGRPNSQNGWVPSCLVVSTQSSPHGYLEYRTQNTCNFGVRCQVRYGSWPDNSTTFVASHGWPPNSGISRGSQTVRILSCERL